MEYESIILACLNTKKPLPFLVDYFYREFKKIEKEHYSADEFFSGCFKVIEKILNLLKEKSLDLEEVIIVSEEIKLKYPNYSWIRKPEPKGVIINYENSSGEIFTLNKAEIIEIKNSIHNAYFRAVPINNEDLLILMNLDNLENIPKKLTNRIPPEITSQILQICEFDIKLAVLENDLQNHIKNKSINEETIRLENLVGFDREFSIKIKEDYLKNVLSLYQSNNFSNIESKLFNEKSEASIAKKSEKLKNALLNYHFYDLPKVQSLSLEKQEKLVELICSNKMPYCIAMFDFLGFLSYLENEYFQSKYERNKELSNWFNSDIDGRSVRGNIDSITKPNKRYTASTHIESVKNDYLKLK